jgi:hypothetical protein
MPHTFSTFPVNARTRGRDRRTLAAAQAALEGRDA